MTARHFEAALLARCALAAKELAPAAQNQREASVFRLASIVIRSQFPHESNGLMLASERYFDMHPHEILPAPEVVGNGWVVSLPRLRDMLSHRLSEARHHA